jgi:hypothetical protein
MSNKQPTAVEWLYNELFYFLNAKSKFEDSDQILDKAKEMEKEQSHLYSAFCFKCINEKIPVIKFEDWINL